MPSLSIIIPTFKRSEILKECLKRLEAQTIANKIEVIVVSDGIDTPTRALFSEGHYQDESEVDGTVIHEIRSWSVPIRFLEIPKSQQGVARNRGIELASAPYCLFIGDDAYLEPNACEVHLATHIGRRQAAGGSSPIPPNADPAATAAIAVLGFTTWNPSLEITPVMKWLEISGWQFGYPKISQYAHQPLPKPIQHQFTYTIHLSLPTELAKKFPFREDVSMYGWEDIEWGMRLRDAGIPLIYQPDAIAYHHHHVTMQQSLQRLETIGKSARYFETIVPGFDRVPKGIKLLLYKLASLMPTMSGRHRRAFLKGLGK